MPRTALLAVVLLGCGSSPAPDGGIVDAGADARTDATVLRCEEPERECPPELPYSGNPCEGELFCSYEDADQSEARCIDGVWSSVATCPGCVLPLAEYCDEPFAGTLTGATVTLGPPGAGRPFEDGEEVSLIVGAQGSPMLAYELHLEGVESPPDCVGRRIALRWDDGDEIVSEVPVSIRLHCGSSRTILLIPPGLPCDREEHDLSVRVPVVDIGEASATLRIVDDGCRG